MPWQRAPDFGKRLYNVEPSSATPIVRIGRDQLSNKARKRKEKEILKGYTRKEIQELKERARVEARKQFAQKMKQISKEVQEEMKQEDAEATNAAKTTEEKRSGTEDVAGPEQIDRQ